MLEIKKIRQHFEDYAQRLTKRMPIEQAKGLLQQAIDIDQERRSVQTSLDQLLSEQKQQAKKIGLCMKNGDTEGAASLKKLVAELKESSKTQEEQLKTASEKLTDILLQIPNIPNALVPAGNTEDDNEVFQDWAEALPVLPDSAKPHWELIQDYDIVDFKLGVKLTGAGFPLYKGQGARLQRALIWYFLDKATQAGFLEVIPPLLVNSDSARGTGQLPDKEGQMYHAVKDDLYLIPTAEVPVTNIYRDEIVSLDDLPIKMTAYTPCFRREAGSYGAHVKGLNRVHQFDKIEIVAIEHPEKSYDMLETMCKHVGGLLGELGLPYRILRLCGGDLGFTSALTYDFEVYSAAQKKWLEVSSVSNFETFQSNRLNLKYRDENNKTQYTHTLNGSALALARIVASILENYQQENHIDIPACLQPYCGFDKISLSK